MKRISSRENPVYKRVARLAAGKRDGGLLLEGIHLCQEWLRHKGLPQLALFDAGRLEHPELQALMRLLNPAQCLIVDSSLVRKLSGVPEGQGALFVVDEPQPQVPATIRRNCLWLDRVQDPGNLGTLLRTAAAVGMQQAYLSTGTAGAWSAKVLRSAQGAHFAMEIFERQDLAQLRHKLAIPLIATALEQASSLYAERLPRDCAWLVGNEGQGVGAELLAVSDRRVFIPQESGVESLNVAVAAAICLFEQRRQHLPG